MEEVAGGVAEEVAGFGFGEVGVGDAGGEFAEEVEGSGRRTRGHRRRAFRGSRSVCGSSGGGIRTSSRGGVFAFSPPTANDAGGLADEVDDVGGGFVPDLEVGVAEFGDAAEEIDFFEVHEIAGIKVAGGFEEGGAHEDAGARRASGFGGDGCGGCRKLRVF